jgi:hypothetical protein
LVVFNRKGGHALDPATGKRKWTGTGNWYVTPLSDVYLDSKGQRGASGGSYCGFHAYANGVWYGPAGFSNSVLAGNTEKGLNSRGQSRMVTCWSWLCQSRACPTAAPAYGRLYYCPNGEGMVYCFENAERAAPAEGMQE